MRGVIAVVALYLLHPLVAQMHGEAPTRHIGDIGAGAVEGQTVVHAEPAAWQERRLLLPILVRRHLDAFAQRLLVLAVKIPLT